jgi:hypothetical protein
MVATTHCRVATDFAPQKGATESRPLAIADDLSQNMREDRVGLKTPPAFAGRSGIYRGVVSKLKCFSRRDIMTNPGLQCTKRRRLAWMSFSCETVAARSARSLRLRGRAG